MEIVDHEHNGWADEHQGNDDREHDDAEAFQDQLMIMRDDAEAFQVQLMIVRDAWCWWLMERL